MFWQKNLDYLSLLVIEGVQYFKYNCIHMWDCSFCCWGFFIPKRLMPVVQCIKLGIWTIVVCLIVCWVVNIDYKSLYMFCFHYIHGIGIKVIVAITKEDCILVIIQCYTQVCKSSHWIWPPITVHVTIWCIMENPITRDNINHLTSNLLTFFLNW